MGLFDKLRRKKPEASSPLEKPAKKYDGPVTEEYTPGGSPVYRYQDHQKAGFQPPLETGVYAKEIEEHFAALFPNRGGFVYHEIVSDIIHIDVHVLLPLPDANFYVLYTTGMSDLPMTLPEDISSREDLKYGELFLFLPGDWNIGEDGQRPSDLPYENLWPVTVLKFLARFPHEYKTWLGFGHTMPNGADYAPFCDNVGFGGVVLTRLDGDIGHMETEDGHDVNLFMVIPAYKEEIEYKLKYGMEGLEKRFQEEKMPLVLDIRRPNYCADFKEILDGLEESAPGNTAKGETGMEEQLAALYNKLAGLIVSMIPVEWKEFHYLGEVEKGKASNSSVFYFRDASTGEFVQSNRIPKIYSIPNGTYLVQWSQLNQILLEIYDCFVDNGQAPWEQMTLSTDASEKFKVNYFYDVMHEKDGGQLAREVVWAYKTFGYRPEEGTAGNRLLDEHLHQ